MKKVDIEALLFMFMLNMKEEKKKEYSPSDECDVHKAYVFENYEEFKNYFINNGIIEIYDDALLRLCIMKETKKGSIISMKKLCDHTIDKSYEKHIQKYIEELTAEKIVDIHNRGKLTIFEKVEEWENIGLCAPGDAIGSASNRCRIFNNCHDCLMNFASNSIEHDPIKIEPLMPYEKIKKNN